MRYRKLTYRYSDVAGGAPRVFTMESWELPRRGSVGAPYFRPAADVIETGDAYLVVLEIPGVPDDEIVVAVHPDALVVSGRRRCPEFEGARYHTAEIRNGPFRFDLALPADVDLETVDASVDRGLMRICMRKRAKGTP